MRAARTVDAWVDGIVAGDRALVAQAVTLVESRRAEDRAVARAVLARLPRPSSSEAAWRVGISGAPGAGKSTLIEALGMYALGLGRKVGVLAVDPTSERTGGSILGDKTRMPRLSVEAGAFVRPSPSGGALGGVAARTREAVTVLEAAGFDLIIVETVGVGQSETAVRHLTDTFVLLALPGAGDELQGIKRGIMEAADVVLVTKADGEQALAAERAAAQLRAALRLLPRDDAWTTPVLTVSALQGTGLGAAWEAIARHRAELAAAGDLTARRAQQAVVAFRRMLDEALRALAEDQLGDELARVEAEVAAGRLAEDQAALDVVARLRGAPRAV
ncbi:MAG: methylmalonyl Co-A mutase-associated GTPase MeaB [Myxococcota bacterium]